MTVYFENNSYKYETEAVMKLFCPLEGFEFVFDGKCDESGDHVLVSVTDKLTVSARLGGKTGHMEEPLCDESDRELALCRMLYRVMSGITGVSPEWGCLTGIRPVKKVNALINEGCSQDEVYERLHEKYFISRRNSDLSYLTAVTQTPKELFPLHRHTVLPHTLLLLLICVPLHTFERGHGAYPSVC